MAANNWKNVAKAKAIEKKNRELLLKVNPKLNDDAGIYFLTRTDADGFKYAYIGQNQSGGILSRLCSHMTGYNQWIDLSLKKHKLYSEDNPYGWRVEFLNFPVDEIDEKEKYYIKKYADAGYQLRNKSLGGQGENRSSGMINDVKEHKGYRDGIKQGYKNASREIANLFDKHLNFSKKSDKPNKNQDKAVEKFQSFLDYYKDESEV